MSTATHNSATYNTEKPERSIRFTRSFRSLQSAVNRYLDDSGHWIGEVNGVLRELNRLTEELDARQLELENRQKNLDLREQSLDRLIASLSVPSVESEAWEYDSGEEEVRPSPIQSSASYGVSVAAPEAIQLQTTVPKPIVPATVDISSPTMKAVAGSNSASPQNRSPNNKRRKQSRRFR